MNVIIYTRQRCHLCDEAYDALRNAGLEPVLVDIDEDPRLREQYDTCVPVVVIDGRERFRGRVNRVLLARLLEASATGGSDKSIKTKANRPALASPNTVTREHRTMQTAGSLKGRILETLGVFAKYWEPGSVKTRLADSIGAEAAARLHKQFVVTLLGRFGHSSDARALVYDPPSREEAFAELITSRWRLAPQSEGDLGARMRAFIESSLAEGSQRVVLIGADSPTLPVAYVRQAFELLRNNEVVLGPAGDGGYYLVGVAKRVPAMFEGIDWGTANVLEQTQEALRRAGTAWVELPAWYDIDELADLERLRDELGKSSSDSRLYEALLSEVNAALAAPTAD